jgi:uncharacterized protein (TIGR00730 family)
MSTTRQEPAFSVAIYCGSRPGNDLTFTKVAQTVGHWIGEHGGRLVYGGGNNGLMGTVAQATLDAGGTVYGVIPQALVNLEAAKSNCTELVVVQNMHERKALMAEHADAFLSIPGGIGTMEELFEIWSWRQLGYHTKPLGLLNVLGCYDALLAFLSHSVQIGFMSEFQMSLLQVDDQPERLLERLVTQGGWSGQSPLLRNNL